MLQFLFLVHLSHILNMQLHNAILPVFVVYFEYDMLFLLLCSTVLLNQCSSLCSVTLCMKTFSRNTFLYAASSFNFFMHIYPGLCWSLPSAAFYFIFPLWPQNKLYQFLLAMMVWEWKHRLTCEGGLNIFLLQVKGRNPLFFILNI